MEDAAEAYRARIETLEANAAEAEARIAELTQAIEAAEGGIAQVTGQEETDAVPAVDSAPGTMDPGEKTETDDGSELSVVIVPEVLTPQALQDASQVDMEEIYQKIDDIVNAGAGEMTDEEKVAALDELKLQLGDYVEELNAALTEISDQEVALAASVDSIEALERELSTAQASVDELSAAIDESRDTIAGLEAQVQALSQQNESDSAQAQAEIDALNERLAAEEERNCELTEQLEKANALLEKRLAELEVYRLARELGEGEAYTASTLNGEIAVAADGTAAQWQYTNDTISGNAVVLSIELDGEEIYRSEPLKPGEDLTEFALARALEPGRYAAVAVMGVYDADGAFVSSTRVPVEISVG